MCTQNVHNLKPKFNCKLCSLAVHHLHQNYLYICLLLCWSVGLLVGLPVGQSQSMHDTKYKQGKKYIQEEKKRKNTRNLQKILNNKLTENLEITHH